LVAPREFWLPDSDKTASEARVSADGSRADDPTGVLKAEPAGLQGILERRGENQPTTGAGKSSGDAGRHRIHLGGGRDAASGARAAIDLITLPLFDDLHCEQLRLMVSELVANSVLHGGADTWADGIELTVLVSPDVFRVECSDPVGGFDVPAAVDGFGLEIIARTASAWGVRYGPLGSTWFEYARN
jgi:hypothetical protein